jgi:hypothetical protein
MSTVRKIKLRHDRPLYLNDVGIRPQRLVAANGKFPRSGAGVYLKDRVIRDNWCPEFSIT